MFIAWDFFPLRQTESLQQSSTTNCRIGTELCVLSLLVDAGLGVGDLVERWHFEAVGVAPLALVHVVAEGQDHLQKLLQVPAVQHLFGGLGQCWDRDHTPFNFAELITLSTHLVDYHVNMRTKNNECDELMCNTCTFFIFNFTEQLLFILSTKDNNVCNVMYCAVWWWLLENSFFEGRAFQGTLSTLTFNFGFDLSDPFGKFLFEVQWLKSLLVVVYSEAKT